MATARTIDHERGFLRGTWTGRVTGIELADATRTLLENAEAMRLGRSLTDLRLAQLEVHMPDISRILEELIVPGLGERRYRMALLVADALQFGICRQFLSLTEPHIEGEAFYDEDEALTWLLRGA